MFTVKFTQLANDGARFESESVLTRSAGLYLDSFIKGWDTTANVLASHTVQNVSKSLGSLMVNELIKNN